MPTNRSPLKRRKARGREISATTLSIWSQLLELRPLGSAGTARSAMPISTDIATYATRVSANFILT